MKTKHRWMGGMFGLLLALLAPGLGGADKKPPAPPPSAIARLAWLAGNWRTVTGGRVIEEQWMAPAAGLMLGMGRTVAKGRVLEHEFLQIRAGPGGDLFYIAHPSGQKEATFPITSLTDTAVVFENPQHDFPQKISYTLQPDGSLLAVTEGPGPGGQLKRIEFHYERLPP